MVATGQATDMSDNMTRYFCNLLISSALRILETTKPTFAE